MLGLEKSSPGRLVRQQAEEAPGRQWYVAETEPRKEGLAVANLERQSFSSLCPRFQKIRRHARREETVLAPLFPGYVFVRFDVDSDPWRSINGTMGVRRLISFNARPQPMPDLAIHPLLARCNDGILAPIANDLRVGEVVRVISGPFAEQLATVESLDDKGRVRVLLDILGRAASLRLGAGSVTAANT